MGQISLNYEDAMRILKKKDATSDSIVIAACTVAFFQTREHAGEIEPSTRSIALKLSHMVAAEIYAAKEGA